MKRKVLLGFIIVMLCIGFTLLVYYYNAISNWIYPNNDASRGEFLKILLSVIGGVGVLFGIYASLKRAKALEEGVKKQGKALDIQSLQIELTRKAQTDERFKNAVEHLGSDNEPVILGGIAELHQIAKENSSDYSEIIFNIFCSYIRSNSEKQGVLTILQTIVNYLFRNYDDNPYLGFKANLSRSKLTGVKFENCVIEFADFSYCEISRIYNTQLRSCDLSNVTFFACTIEQSNFYDCKLYKSIFFLGSLNSSNFNFLDILSPITFLDTTLENVQFSKENISDWRLIGCRLKNVLFTVTCITSSKFLITEFDEVTFKYVDLFGGNDFRGSNMNNVSMDNIIITNSNFNGVTRHKEIGVITESKIRSLNSNITDIKGLNGVVNFYRSSSDQINDSDVEEILSLYNGIHDRVLPPKIKG